MKVWLAVCLTAALVRDGWGRTSVVDRIIAKKNVVDNDFQLGFFDGNKLFGDSFNLSNTTTFRTRTLDPYDVDADREKAARFGGAMKLSAVKMNLSKKGFKGLGGKLKKMKGAFKKLHKNKITDRAKAGWKKIKETYNKIPDKSKMIKEILKEAWSFLGNFELREIIFAALAELGLIPECSCYFNDKLITHIKKLISEGKEDLIRGRVRCGCCIKPFDWKSLCLMVKVDAKERSFEVSLEFDDKEFLALPIKFKKGDGAAPPKSACVPEHRLAIGQERCAYLGDIPFVDICLRPREIEIHKEDDGRIYFGSCIQIVVDFLYYTYEKCFQFDLRNMKLSVVEDDDE